MIRVLEEERDFYKKEYEKKKLGSSAADSGASIRSRSNSPVKQTPNYKLAVSFEINENQFLETRGAVALLLLSSTLAQELLIEKTTTDFERDSSGLKFQKQSALKRAVSEV